MPESWVLDTCWVTLTTCRVFWFAAADVQLFYHAEMQLVRMLSMAQWSKYQRYFGWEAGPPQPPREIQASLHKGEGI